MNGAADGVHTKLHMGAYLGYTAGLRSFRQVSNNQISNCIY